MRRGGIAATSCGLIVLAIAALALVSCGEEMETAETSGTAVRVAVVTPSPTAEPRTETLPATATASPASDPATTPVFIEQPVLEVTAAPRPLPPAFLQPPPAYERVTTTYDHDLEVLIREALGADVDRYGVVVRNLNTASEAAVNPDKVFYAASLFKLPVLYEAYRQRQLEILDFDLTVTLTEADVEYDLDTLELHGWQVGKAVTLGEMVRAMIVTSDNTSANIISDIVGRHNIDRDMAAIGLSSTAVNDISLPTTAADMALLLEMMAREQAVDASASREMVSLLAQQYVRDRLPALLPPDTIVANKTGNWVSATHDVGIVYSPEATYVIAVLSEADWESEPIARLSEAVYYYFNPQLARSP